MKDFAGKVAVVTGAGSGIGLALAQRLSAEGAWVALADVDEGALERAAEVIIAAGAAPATVLTQRVDVRLEAEVDALADRVFDTWGQVDVLCNNAGVMVGGSLWDRPAADLEFVLGVNLWGILHGIRAFVPRMLVQGTEGHIVNTCSVAGLVPSAFCGPYNISKYAALAASESLAVDFELTGAALKVTALCPGMVQTGLDVHSREGRPAELATPPAPDAEFVLAALTDMLAEGISADDVAAMVVDAIVDERFLVLTHPHHEPVVRQATEDRLAGRHPASADYR